MQETSRLDEPVAIRYLSALMMRPANTGANASETLSAYDQERGGAARADVGVRDEGRGFLSELAHGVPSVGTAAVGAAAIETTAEPSAHATPHHATPHEATEHPVPIRIGRRTIAQRGARRLLGDREAPAPQRSDEDTPRRRKTDQPRGRGAEHEARTRRHLHDLYGANGAPRDSNSDERGPSAPASRPQGPGPTGQDSWVQGSRERDSAGRDSRGQAPGLTEPGHGTSALPHPVSRGALLHLEAFPHLRIPHQQAPTVASYPVAPHAAGRTVDGWARDNWARDGRIEEQSPRRPSRQASGQRAGTRNHASPDNRHADEAQRTNKADRKQEGALPFWSSGDAALDTEDHAFWAGVEHTDVFAAGTLPLRQREESARQAWLDQEQAWSDPEEDWLDIEETGVAIEGLDALRGHQSDHILAYERYAHAEAASLPHEGVMRGDRVETWDDEEAVDTLIWQTTPSSLGAALLQARTQKGMSIAEVSSITRIPLSVLYALESDDAAQLPSAVFVRGHVRSVAMTLGAEMETLMGLCASQYGAAPSTGTVVGMMEGVSSPWHAAQLPTHASAEHGSVKSGTYPNGAGRLASHDRRGPSLRHPDESPHATQAHESGHSRRMVSGRSQAERRRTLGAALACAVLLVLFTLAFSVVMRPREKDMVEELSWQSTEGAQRGHSVMRGASSKIAHLSCGGPITAKPIASSNS